MKTINAYCGSMKMKYRYEINPGDLGGYRNTILPQEFDVLDPDGFVTDESTGDAIIKQHGWRAEKTAEE